MAVAPLVVANGGRIRASRARLKLSQSGLAGLLRTTQAQVSRVECGTPTRYATLLAIAYVLHDNVEDYVSKAA